MFLHNRDDSINFVAVSEICLNLLCIIMTKDQIDYVTCVIGALALMTGESCSVIYKKLQSAGIIKDYLVASFDVLHTFSLEYVAEDVIDLMKRKGHALC